MTLYKLVNGQRVEMSKKEEKDLEEERVVEAQRPISKTIEERVADIEKRLTKLEK